MRQAIVLVSNDLIAEWLGLLGVSGVTVIGAQPHCVEDGTLAVKLSGPGLPEDCEVALGGKVRVIDVELTQMLETGSQDPRTAKVMAKFIP